MNCHKTPLALEQASCDPSAPNLSSWWTLSQVLLSTPGQITSEPTLAIALLEMSSSLQLYTRNTILAVTCKARV